LAGVRAVQGFKPLRDANGWRVSSGVLDSINMLEGVDWRSLARFHNAESWRHGLWKWDAPSVLE
jgi:hypothetical protein